MTDLQKKEEKLAHRLRNRSRLRVYFDEMLETVEFKNNESIKTADDAEDLVVAQIRKTG